MMMALFNATSVFLAGRLSETGPQTPVMDLVWWAWLLIVGAAIVVGGLAIAWQAHLTQPPHVEHSEGEPERH
jgi:hypothetical protein